VYKSVTRPTHKTGAKVLDGINWGVVQDEVTYTAGVRNVVFRDIFLHKPRTAFTIHFDNDKYSPRTILAPPSRGRKTSCSRTFGCCMTRRPNSSRSGRQWMS
jgi:hypothetical protein